MLVVAACLLAAPSNPAYWHCREQARGYNGGSVKLRTQEAAAAFLGSGLVAGEAGFLRKGEGAGVSSIVVF